MLFKLLKRVSVAIAMCYATGVTLLWAFQRDLMYLPDRMPPVPPSHYAMLDGVRQVTLETADGLELTAWYAAAPAARPTVVLLPGNGGSLRNSRYRLKHFKDAGLGVLLVSYRGYSGNPGTPSEQGLYADARAITEPVLVMHGDRDSVIPQALGRRLYEAARTVKEGFWPRGVGHDDLFDRGGFETAVDFISRFP